MPGCYRATLLSGKPRTGTNHSARVVIPTKHPKNADWASRISHPVRLLRALNARRVQSECGPPRSERALRPLMVRGADCVYHRPSLLSSARMADADFATLIHNHRGYLLRVAILQLRDSDLAEDV